MRYRLALLLALPLAACSSPQTHYYALQPVAAGAAAPAIGPGQPIVLRHVMLPAELDRLEIVTQGSGGVLNISDQDRWAAPLDGMVQTVLAADLLSRLPGQVLMPGDPTPPGDTRVLALNIRRFSGDAAGRVTLVADWSLLAGKPAAPLVGKSSVIETQSSLAHSEDMVPA